MPSDATLWHMLLQCLLIVMQSPPLQCRPLHQYSPRMQSPAYLTMRGLPHVPHTPLDLDPQNTSRLASETVDDKAYAQRTYKYTRQCTGQYNQAHMPVHQAIHEVVCQAVHQAVHTRQQARLPKQTSM
jgi:hypothetical protein